MSRREELLTERDSLTHQLRLVILEIEKIKGKKRDTGVFVDSLTWNSLNSRATNLRRQIDIVQAQLRRIPKTNQFERHFFDAAKAILDTETMAKIVTMANGLRVEADERKDRESSPGPFNGVVATGE